jgi:hypothetical protein
VGSIAGIRLSPRHVGGAVLLAMALLSSLNDNGIEPFISNGKANGSMPLSFNELSKAIASNTAPPT